MEAERDEDEAPVLDMNSEEFTTPPSLVALVVDFLGVIDLDPTADAALTIPAQYYFTKADDCLARPWIVPSRDPKGPSVYMNCPYGRRIHLFTRKLLLEYRTGHLREALLLVPSKTGSGWFRDIWQADAACFWYGRLRFSGLPGSGRFDSVLAYYGPRRHAFAAAFEPYGHIP